MSSVPRSRPSLIAARRRACAVVAAVVAVACTHPQRPMPEPTLEDDTAAGLDARIGGAIEASLPEVSYETDNPALRDPLGRTDPSVIERNVESLDGTQRIVCFKREQRAFGDCAFPEPQAP